MGTVATSCTNILIRCHPVEWDLEGYSVDIVLIRVWRGPPFTPRKTAKKWRKAAEKLAFCFSQRLTTYPHVCPFLAHRVRLRAYPDLLTWMAEMAAINRLTALQVKNLGEGSHSDGGNLYLRVRGNGRRWAFRYKVPKGWPDEGKPVEIGLGSVNSRSLADARKLAVRMRAEIEDNRDPALLLKPVAEPEAKTFSDYAAELIESKKSGWRSGKHLAQWPSTLAAYAYPFIGKKRPGAITFSDVQAILTPL